MSRRNASGVASHKPLADALDPAATYGRASTNEVNQAQSLITQRLETERFVGMHSGWSLAAHFEEYASGKNQKRPQLQALLASAEAGDIKVIVVQRIDRLARSLADLLQILERLDAAGVAFYSVHENFDTSTIGGRLLLQMLGAMAEFERRLLLERVVGGQRTKVVELKRPLSGRSLPYGTRINPDTKKLEKDLDVSSSGGVSGTWPVVERIFDSYLNRGLSPNLIAEALNDDGFRTRAGGPWPRNRVDDVLRNRAYVGELRYRDEWIKDCHAPMLDIAMFDKVQDRFKTNAIDHAKRMAMANASVYLLSGVMRCDACGSAMIGSSTTNAAARYRYYICSRKSRMPGPQGCVTKVRVLAEPIERSVIDAVLDTLKKDDLWIAAHARYLALQQSNEPNLVGELAEIRTNMTATRRILDRYRTDYESEKLDADQWRRGVAEHEPRLSQLQAVEKTLTERLDERSALLPSPAGREAVVGALRAALEGGSALALRQKVIRGVVESVVTADGRHFQIVVNAPTRAAAQRLVSEIERKAS